MNTPAVVFFLKTTGWLPPTDNGCQPTSAGPEKTLFRITLESLPERLPQTITSGKVVVPAKVQFAMPMDAFVSVESAYAAMPRERYSVSEPLSVPTSSFVLP